MLTTGAMIFVTSVVFWVLYYMAFREAPENGVTVVLVAFAALCVLGVKGMINRLRKKEKKP